MILISRKQAVAADLKLYFTGKPCVNGHIAHRYTKSGACRECVNPKPMPASAPETPLAVRARFVQHPVFIQLRDLPQVLEFALSLGRLMYPGTAEDFIFPMQAPTQLRGGVGRYRFCVPVDCLPAFVAFVDEINRPKAAPPAGPPALPAAATCEQFPPGFFEAPFK